jgi:DNA-binding SARP family transcriptional activator/tetratricopeptide (TPR) repeat protein
MFRLKTLGGVLVEGPDGPLTGAATQRRRLAVLSILAASGGGISRDRLVAMLWPESDDERARHALSQLLYGLRRELGGDAVTGSATSLRLNGEVLTSDIGDFNEAGQRGDLERVAGLYAGPFLDGFYLSGCAEFERWVEDERTRSAERARSAIEALAERAAGSGDTAGAVNWWRRLAALERFDSRIAIALMKALAASGDRGAAIRHARVHETLVRDELGVEPDPEVASYSAKLAAQPTVPAAPAAKPVEAPIAAAPSSEPVLPKLSVRRRLRPAVVAAAGFMTIALAVTLGSALWPISPPAPDWVIIADAENTTGDPAFDRVLSVGLAAQIRQSPRVYVTTPERVRQALVRMRQPGADSALSEALARDIAQREGIRMAVVPGITRADSSYELSAKLVEPASGAVVALETVHAERRRDIVDALDRLGRRVRRRLGEPLLSVATRSVSLPTVTTPSLEALQKFADGNRAFSMDRLGEARTLWQQAIAIDSSFAAAHVALGGLDFWVNRQKDGDAHFEQALALMGSLPDREQLTIRARVESWRGNREKSTNLWRSYLLGHPDDLDAWFSLGYDYLRMVRDSLARDAFERVVAVDSTNYSAYINLALVTRNLGDYPLALAHYRRAFGLMPSLETANNNIPLEFATTFVFAGQLDSAAAVFAKMLSGDRLTRARGLRSLAYLAMYRGRYAEASRHLSEAIVLARVMDQPVTAVRNRLLLATALEHRGLFAEAMEQVDSAYAVTRRSDAEPTFLFWVGKALARAGNAEGAAELLKTLEGRGHEGSTTDLAALEGLRGELLVAQNKAAEGVSHLQISRDADPDRYTLESLAHGMAAAGNLERAAALYEELARDLEFGWEAQDYWRTANYWLGRIEEQRQDPQLAARAYQRFLDAWGEAEPGLTLVVDARDRLVRLQTSGVVR